MNNQTNRLIGMVLAAIVCGAAIFYDSAGAAAVAGFLTGVWCFAYLRRVIEPFARKHGINLEDTP